LKESDKLSKRTTSDELIRDLWHIAYAYTNKKVTNQIKCVFAGFKGFQSTICEIPELYPDDPAAAFMKLVEVVKSLDADNKSLRKANTKLTESIETLRKDLIDSNGEIQQLKKSSANLGQFKYANVREVIEATNKNTNKRKRTTTKEGGDREEEITSDNDEQVANELHQQLNGSVVEVGASATRDEAGVSETREEEAPFTLVQAKRRYAAAAATAPTTKPNIKSTTKGYNNNNARKPNYIKSNRSKCVIKRGIGDPGSNQYGVKAAVRRFHFHTDSWDTSTRSSDVKDHVETKIGHVLEIEELPCRSMYYKKFRVTVEDYLAEKMRDPSNWPRNVRVSRFIFPRTEKTGATQLPNSINSQNGTDPNAIQAAPPSYNNPDITNTNKNNNNTTNEVDDPNMQL
jgi:hypothetical protein